MILQHYGVKSNLGQKCRALLEALQLELGCLGSPLLESFPQIGHLATSCWWKAVWERLHHFNFHVLMDYPILAFPREHDTTLVSLFLRQLVNRQDLRSLNRC